MTTLITTRRSGFSIGPILLTLNAIILAFCVFSVTQAVKTREARVTELNHQILAEQQTMRVLDAEWAYLTRPQRLEELLAMKEAKIEAQEKKEKTEVAEETAKVEPSSGQIAPVVSKPSVKKAEITKVEKPKASTKAAQTDFIWSPKKNSKVKTQQVASYRRPGGIAKPIVE